jgi:regulator of cell morphogenesis and NO signaling
MARFEATQSVGAVVARAPATSRVFERHGIDYCCGGGTPLRAACASRGLDVAAILAELDAEVASGPPERDWTGADPVEVIDHVLSTHHVFVKRELPRLDALMEKVRRVHGDAHPDVLPAMAGVWERLSAELAQHLLKEEQILFPSILALAQGRPGGMPPSWLEGPIGAMEQEHVDAGEAVARLRALSGGFVPPADACGSWRALWSGLEDFERDLHRHIHLENEVLHPAARRLAGI